MVHARTGPLGWCHCVSRSRRLTLQPAKKTTMSYKTPFEISDDDAWAYAYSVGKSAPYCGYGFTLKDGSFLRCVSGKQLGIKERAGQQWFERVHLTQSTRDDMAAKDAMNDAYPEGQGA